MSKGGLAKRAAARYKEVYGDLEDSDDEPPRNVYLAMTGLYTSTPVVSCTYTYIYTYIHISLYYIYISVHIIMCVG